MSRATYGSSIPVLVLLLTVVGACKEDDAGDPWADYELPDEPSEVGDGPYTLPPPKHGVQFAMVGPPLEPYKESYWCQVIEISEDMNVNAILIQSRRWGLHDLTLWQMGDDPGEWIFNVAFPCGEEDGYPENLHGLERGWNALFSNLDTTVDRRVGLVFPKDYGYKLRRNSRLMLQAFYLNPTDENLKEQGLLANFHSIPDSLVEQETAQFVWTAQATATDSPDIYGATIACIIPRGLNIGLLSVIGDPVNDIYFNGTTYISESDNNANLDDLFLWHGAGEMTNPFVASDESGLIQSECEFDLDDWDMWSDQPRPTNPLCQLSGFYWPPQSEAFEHCIAP